MSESIVKRWVWKPLVNGINLVLGAFCGSLMILMLLLTCVNVVMRYAFNTPIAWADQFTSYGLVYLTFIGAPYVLSKYGHVSVDIFAPKEGSEKKKIVAVAINIVGLIYSCLFFVLAIKELLKVIAKKSVVLDAIVVPEWIVIAVIPIGFGFLIIQFIYNISCLKHAS